MDSGAAGRRVSVPLRSGGGGGGKRMKKRKELDALATSRRDALLSAESTDEREDYWGSRSGGGGGGGRGSSRHAPRLLLLRRSGCGGGGGALVRACAASLVFACVVATTTVMWLFIDVRDQVSALRTQLDQVVAGSQGVPDALQKCHSVSKELQENQTAIFKRISTLTQDLENFTTQLTAVQTSLRSVEDQLKAAPELVSVPKDLQELKKSVASFGSQIRDLDSRVTSVKDQNGKLQDLSSGLLQNLTSLRSLVDLLSNHSQQLQPSLQDRDAEKAMLTTINELVRNLSSVNATLSKKIQWTTDDQRPDHAAIQNMKDSVQNVSARLRTLEEKCVDYTSNEAALQSTLSRLIVQSNGSESHWQDLTSQLLQIRSQYNELADNVTEVRSMLDNIQRAESAQLQQYLPATRDLNKVTTSYGEVGFDGSMETTSKYSAR